MLILEFTDIDLQWVGEPPADRVLLERLIRSELRHHEPIDPTDLPIFFVQHATIIILVCCQSEKSLLCTWFA